MDHPLITGRLILATLLVISAAVLTGCGAFGGTPSPPEVSDTTSTPTGSSTPTLTATSSGSSERVPVAGELSMNATAVWERVESLFGGEYDPPSVSVRDVRGFSQTPPFATHLGLDDGAETFATRNPGGLYQGHNNNVLLLTQNGSSTEIERILAHEYVHAIQDRIGFLDRSAARNRSAVKRALAEGSAMYVEDTYAREFLGFSSIDRECSEYMNGTPHVRYINGPYCLGGKYFSERLDSPSDLSNPDLSLPSTTEQMLHPGKTEPPANLSVNTKMGSAAANVQGRQGELFIRTVLGVELDKKRASEAAAGWGNDRLIRVTGDAEGYVWILRWDTEADTEEFTAAFGTYLDARGERTANGWNVDSDRYRVSAVDDRTVAVVTGSGTFTDTVAVTERHGNVTVQNDSTETSG